MADPRAFVSFDFDNNETERMLFVGQAKNSRTPFVIQDWSSKSALPQSQWERIIEDKIARCHMVIVLVGRRMSTAIGVKKEIDMANRRGIPIFGIYVDGANYLNALPEGLSRSRVIPWTWLGVAEKIDQMVQEAR